MSLTDRMAAALRALYDREPFDGSRIQEQARTVLAEYDAMCKSPRPAKITAGSHVRCTRASKRTRDYQAGDEAKVQYLVGNDRAVVTWLTDLGDDHLTNRSPFLRLADCELALNLPATNTGD